MNRKAFISAIIIFAFLISTVATIQVIEVAQAQISATVTINPDGSVIGTNNIQRNSNVYTLTGNISGGIQVQKSHIVIDGAGYSIEGNGQYVRGINLSNGVGQDPSRSTISNVTVKNLKIINCYYAIDNANTNNNTFFGNYIANSDTGFWITGSSNNTLIRNTVKDCVTGISINYAGLNIITENNIINNSLLVWLSTEPLVDRNYWSNYLTKYPNAKEIEKSGLPNPGIWDTPYNYGESLGNFTDNHPLVNPVSISDFSFPSPIPSSSPSTAPRLSPTLSPIKSPTQQPTPTEVIPFVDPPDPTRSYIFYSIIIAATFLVVSLAVYFKKIKKQK